MRIRKLRLPSFPDLFFAALLGVVCGRAGGLETFLADGDTGWHIRTGEWILRHHAVPCSDLFSFTRPDAPWMAWEWLTDVVFAKLYSWYGLGAVAGVCAVALCLASAVLMARLLEREAGLWLAAGIALMASSASTIHYLARPHVFSVLFFTLGGWLLDRERARPTRLIWILPLLTVLWANMHGGFTLWLAVLWLLATVAGFERDWRLFRRYTRMAALCSAATLVNPYGWNLHRHIAGYLMSGWILDHVQEFQPPQIRSENMVVFAVLLVAGLATAARTVGPGCCFEPLLIGALALASLRSARHVPFYAIAAAPLIAGESGRWWRQAAGGLCARSAVGLLWKMGAQLSERRGFSIWMPVLGCLVFAATASPVPDFPAQRFPVQAVTAPAGLQAWTGASQRLLTSDQWADYLIFRFDCQRRVFFDGRSDFYGEELGEDYAALLNASPRAREVLARYRIDAALLPHEWALGRMLEGDLGWEIVYRDPVASLFVRRPKENPGGCRMR